MAPWSLIESRRRIVREFRVLASDVTSCRAAFRARYEKRIADTLATLQELDCLDPVDARHISLAINDAARCYYSVHWWFLFEAAIKNRCRIQASIGVVAAVVVLVWFAIMPKPEFSHVTINTVFWAFLTVALLSFVAYLLHSLVPYRYKIIVFIVEAVAALVAVAEFQSWSPHAAIIWKTLASSLSFIDAQHKKQFAAAPVADMLQLALWIMAMISGAKATWRIISFQAKASISRLQYGYGRPAEQCAELIIGFLNISRYISELLDRMEATIARPQNYLWLDASGLPSILLARALRVALKVSRSK